MEPKLILVEGLPGSGKSTTAQLIQEILTEQGVKTELFLEGNLDHPADYDAISCFTEDEWKELLQVSGELATLFVKNVEQKGSEYFLPYGKLIHRQGIKIPDDVFNRIFKHDIYELPLEKNIELMTARWKEFADHALNGEKTYIFECCFIQNPVTVGMIKYNTSSDKIIRYIDGLAKVVEELNPLLVYVDQSDLSYSFGKAVKERPEEWYKGFVEYYTGQGFGMTQGYDGYEGTLKVLEARKKLETEIFDSLTMPKVKIDNSSFDKEEHKQRLTEIVT